jgi:hypothetical protein
MDSRPYYYNKPSSVKKEIIRKPWKLPMAAQHLAAITIQRMIRGFLCRRRLKGEASFSVPKEKRLKY